MSMLDNHKILFSNAALFFTGLTVMVAIIPALSNQNRNRPLPGAPALSKEARIGKGIYIANGCVACHTQQVRNIDMDRVWGERPGLAADYAANTRTDLWRNTATLMGTERTGPDLTNVGARQPGKDWNLVHLFNPRIVVKESVMPAYPWLFQRTKNPRKSDVVVNVPAAYLNEGETIIATKDALYLLAYLQSLKQAALPQSTAAPEFLYKKEKKESTAAGAAPALDGKALYAANCQSCHQENGEGLPGAFPPLRGSTVVTGADLEKYVDIIMNGYDARAEYGVMPPVGTNMNFTENEIAAIINHERTSWGNDGKKVAPEEVKKIIDLLKLKTE